MSSIEKLVDRLKEVKIPELEKYAYEFVDQYLVSKIKNTSLHLWAKSWKVETDFWGEPKINKKKERGFLPEYEIEPQKQKIRIINAHKVHKIIEPEFLKYIKEKRIRFTDIFDKNVFED